MFYCDPCQVKHDWPRGMVRSHGKCEMCGEHGECHDVPSSDLPPAAPPAPPVPTDELERPSWACKIWGTADHTYGTCVECLEGYNEHLSISARRSEMIAALSEAIHIADTEDVQQSDTEIHLRFGRYRIRADVTEIVLDPPQVEAPSPRSTDLSDKREQQLLQGVVAALGRQLGARLAPNVDLGRLDRPSAQGLRLFLKRAENSLKSLASDADAYPRKEVRDGPNQMGEGKKVQAGNRERKVRD